MITGCFPIAGGDFLLAGSASRQLKEQLKRIGVDGQIMRRIMIAAYEAEMNVVIHAFRGNLWVRFDRDRFNLEVIDEGPGIPDLTLAMKPGFSTAPAGARQLGFGAGMGLPNIERASDCFQVDSQRGKGTRVRSTIYLKKQAAARPPASGPALSIESERCVGCLDCVKACPTLALRVWDRRPQILAALCIDCTACIGACGRGVFTLRSRDGTAAPPDPGRETERATLVIPQAFLTQFGSRPPPGTVLAALLALGFRDVRFTEEWEEELRRRVRRYAAEEETTPVIAPICPAVTALIESQFPSLVAQIAPFMTPMEAAARASGLGRATLVAACPGQLALLDRTGLPDRIDILAPEELSARVLPLLAAQPEGADSEDRPAARGSIHDPSVLEVWGMDQVIDVLEATEKGLTGDFRVLELSFCVRGCYGTPLFPENPFAAEKRWRASRLGRRRQVSAPAASGPYLARPGVRLDPVMARAIEKLARIDELAAGLPGRDCGACGAPTCSSLAEDIVLERGSGLQCVFEGKKEQS